MLKQLLAVVAGFGLAVGVFAADVVLQPDHPDVYVVQKGDTLWDISGRFLTKPWLWPEIWQANPQVENPHLIYPGDRLSLAYLDGRPYLSHDGGPRVRREPLDEAITAVSLGEIEPFLRQVRVVDDEDVKTLPYVVALEEDRLRSTNGQVAYVRGLDDAEPGQRVVLARPGNAYYELSPDSWWRHDYRGTGSIYSDKGSISPWDPEQGRPIGVRQYSERGHTIGGWWADTAIMNPGKRKSSDYLGTEVYDIGEGEVLRTGDPGTVLIQYGDVEIKAGDLVLVTPSAPFDLTFYPRAPQSVPEGMVVMSFVDALNAVGPKQIVALNRGAEHGIENGHTFSIFQPGHTIRDNIAYADADTRTIFSERKASVVLPEEFVGHVMVFRTFDHMSYGLVMDAIRPTHIGDRLRTPLN
jgi:hypothetical protein